MEGSPMPKDIAVISYNTDPSSALTADAIVIRDILNNAGYSAKLVHQWSLSEPDTSTFKQASDWERYDGVVIGRFYGFWTLRVLIQAARPVLCVNCDYADDLGLGERPQQHMSEDDFNVVNNIHPVTSGAGLALGPLNVGNAVWIDSVSTLNHHVDVLIATLANQ